MARAMSAGSSKARSETSRTCRLTSVGHRPTGALAEVLDLLPLLRAARSGTAAAREMQDQVSWSSSDGREGGAVGGTATTDGGRTRGGCRRCGEAGGDGIEVGTRSGSDQGGGEARLEGVGQRRLLRSRRPGAGEFWTGTAAVCAEAAEVGGV